MTDRTELHELIDQLPEVHVPHVQHILSALAPEDEFTPEEIESILEASRNPGKCVPLEEVMKRYGVEGD